MITTKIRKHPLLSTFIAINTFLCANTAVAQDQTPAQPVQGSFSSSSHYSTSVSSFSFKDMEHCVAAAKAAMTNEAGANYDKSICIDDENRMMTVVKEYTGMTKSPLKVIELRY